MSQSSAIVRNCSFSKRDFFLPSPISERGFFFRLSSAMIDSLFDQLSLTCCRRFSADAVSGTIVADCSWAKREKQRVPGAAIPG